MKIFDWVHRKLHPNVDYSMVSRKKDSWKVEVKGGMTPVKSEKETQALLCDEVSLTKVFQGWPDGILAIGTLGLGLPCDAEYSDSDSNADDEYSVSGNEGEEALPQQQQQRRPPAAKVSAVVPNRAAAAATEEDDDEERLLKPAEAVIAEPPEEKKKAERTTLADLFSAEAAPPQPPPPPSVNDCRASGKAPAAKKPARSLAKKLMPWKGEDSRPTAKIHRLFTKMLKRKIHPEIENMQGGSGAGLDFPSSEEGVNTSNNNLGQNESASLLQDTVVA